MSEKSFLANLASRIRGQKSKKYKIEKVVGTVESGSVLIYVSELPTMEETIVTLSGEEAQYLAKALGLEHNINWLPGHRFSTNGQTPGEYFFSLISEIGE